ncbi:MAG: LysE family translocator [Spirochaetales bacterium]|nr:LysE family translocator [Spirochaetales bacterium]
MKAILLPAILFIFTMSITPGPNNMVLTASGARFGYARTLPLLLGILAGMQSLLLLSALGLGVLFDEFPLFHDGLKFAGTAYILYLAARIAFFSHSSGEEKKVEKPLSLLQGILLQYINPKAYIMAVTVVSVYPRKGEMYRSSLFLIALAFAVIPFFSISLWTGFGSLLSRWMVNERTGKPVGYVLGGLTAASAVFIIL